MLEAEPLQLLHDQGKMSIADVLCRHIKDVSSY